jgi:uncharacterized protein (TIGR02270 family)
VRFSAWRSAMLLGDASALAHLDRFVESEGTRDRAIDLALRRLTLPDANGWLMGLARDANLLPAAIRGFGVLGDPSAVPFLLEAIRSPVTAGSAGEAFSSMTGLAATEGEGCFTRDRGDRGNAGDPVGRERSSGEDTEDEEESRDPGDGLWPVPERIALWWKENGSRFRAGVRHLRGKEMNPGNLQDILRFGNQEARAVAAVELFMMGNSRALFDVRAHGGNQQRLLGIR